MPTFTFDDVSKRFGGVAALESVSMELRAGEVHGLIGPNGAGKSTAVNIGTGLYRPDTGKVELDGRDVTALSPESRARLGIGRTFQTPRLFESMSVAEVVRVSVEQCAKFEDGRRRRHLIRERVEAVLKETGLLQEANTLSRSLPYGRKKQLEMVRANIFGRRVLFLDEPTAGMTGDETIQLLRPILEADDERAVLLIEHNVDLVMRLCDRVTVLESGRWLACGTPKEIRNDPEVIRAYLGSSGEVK
jgi:branched-chain amino acid transport system ATP-binding protein